MAGDGGPKGTGVRAPAPWQPGKPLRPIERTMLANAAVGEITNETFDEPVDLQTMRSWGNARTVRAEVVRHLLVTNEWPLHATGLYLSGLRIAGSLDLSGTTVRSPLWLWNCLAADQRALVMSGATMPELVIYRCQVGGVYGRGATVSGMCALDESILTGPLVLLDAEVGGLSGLGTTFAGTDRERRALFADRVRVRGSIDLTAAWAAGAIRFVGADIGGQLALRGTTISTADDEGYAFRIGESTVRNLVLLDEGFWANGAVHVAGADVASLQCDGATVRGTDSDGDSVFGDRLTVRGGVFLRRFTARGTVRLPHATIHGPLECQSSVFAGAKIAVMANRITVKGPLVLTDTSLPHGALHLIGGVIEGQLSCQDATLADRDKDGFSLVAQSLTVRESAFFDGSFSAVGGLSFVAANVHGSLSLDGARLGDGVALAAQGATVGQELRWMPREPVTGLVDLDRVSVPRLVDDWSRPSAHWPPAGKLRLTGFTFDSFGGFHQANAQQRVGWLRLQHGPGGSMTFASQPYEQLVRVFRAAGQEADARTTAIAARNDLRKYGSLTRARRVTNWVLDKTIKHGYQPFRAVLILAVFYVAVVVAFVAAQHRDGAMVATKPPANTAPAARDCSAAYPCFYPPGYALDLVVPIVDVHQAEYWRPDGSRPWGWAYVAGTWVATGAGWALSTLAVVAYTSLVRKE